MKPQELELLAQEQNENPYYFAYALTTGAENAKEAFARDGSNAEFFAWNSRMWDETCAREGLNRHFCSSFYNEHLKTISKYIR